MSNSPLVTYKRLSKDYSHRLHKIDTITIHCYVGQVTAKEGCDYFTTTPREVSSNYVVGYDGSIGLSVEEKHRAWTTGSRSNDHRAITIEVACDLKHPYKVTSKAYEALIKLVADICKRNKIKELKWKADKSLIGKPTKQNMTVHRWFQSTDCPGEYLYSHMGDIADKVNEILKPTKGSLGTVIVKTNGSSLNCRKEPSIASKKLGKFKNGRKLSIVEKTNSKWYRVKGKSVAGPTIIGYVSTKYIV